MKKLLVVLAVLTGIILSGCVREEDKMGWLYIADYPNKRIMILDTDLNYVDNFETPNYPCVMAADQGYIYMGSYTDEIIYKFNRASPYAQVASQGNRAGFDMDDYGDYLYLAEVSQTNDVQIINKSDLSLANSISDVSPQGITADESCIYVTNFKDGGYNLIKYNRSTLAEISSVDIKTPGRHYGGMAVDDTYVYVASWKNNNTVVDLYNKSDLSYSHSITTGGSASGYDEYHIAVDGDYAFVVDEDDHVVRKIKVSTDTVVATFGVVGESGSDTSHLNSPYDIAFYPSSLPSVPTDLLCNGQTNPIDIIPQYFSAIYNDPDTGDVAKHYRLQVNKESDFSGRMMWDSDKTSMSNVNEGERCGNIDYNGQALSLNKIKYYWRIKFWDADGNEGAWSAAANFTMAGSGAGEMGAGPWEEDVLEPTGEVKVEIPRRSGQWTTLGNVMRIHTSNGKDTSSPRAPVEIGQAEVTCSNIDKDFNSFEEASDWYKNLEGYAVQIKVGCKVGGTPISRKLFTGIISSVDVDRLSLTAEVRVVDFLDYFGRITLEETPVWENISLTQLYKNLVELAFTDWTEGVDYFVEDLGGSTIPAIGYTDLNLLSELKNIAESRGMRLYTDVNGKLVCRSRSLEGEPWIIKHDYNLEDVTERRDIDTILNWVVVHARPHQIKPDLEPPGKIAGFTATPGDQKIDLSWNNPMDEDFKKVLIRFMTTRYPLNKEEGTKIYEGTGESKEHTGLTNGQKYYYSAFTVDDVGNWSDVVHVSAIAGVGGDTWEDDTGFYGGPGISQVSQFTAIPEHSKVILIWLNPNAADLDSVVIRRSTSSYPPSPTSGSSVYTGTAETTTDTGLTNGKRYYYSAFAKNTGGDYSSATFASAIPAGEREIINSQKIFGGGCLAARWTGPIFTEQEVYGCPDCNVLGTNYSRNIELRFDGIRGYSENWLKFRHEWDIWVHSAYAYKSNEKHVSGRKDDLDLEFSHDIGGIVNVTVTKIVVRSNQVKINYKIAYTGGKAMCIGYRNKLSLMG